MAKTVRGAARSRRVRASSGPAAHSLVRAAWKARMMAVAPFSGFKVGAALRGSTGRVFTGCNIENSTYGLTVCAERVAVFKAISEGARSFREIAVVAESGRLTPPCGACRQILWEFCGDIDVVLANHLGEERRVRLSELFPQPFESSFFRPQPPEKEKP